ncbi:helix-turn-helix domain-containing protein [Pseudonocardia lacus]|uniref:helix-turn-helix domain-containing protein n=1 Tax=Pseudonocardia lacus TaxID=2835865 RepID=UPI001BDBF3D0|nr:helix-turn-helix transcriptional regulator [Pseudonocardia lacus]
MATPRAVAQPTSAGELLRFWRQRRRMSQLDLAVAAEVSTKHLSFVETGKARPSRQLLVHLADALAVPLRERNRLLLAGGFAPPHRERPFQDRAMQPLRQALTALLTAHEPNPALIVNAHWELVAANTAADLLFDGVHPDLLTPPVNLLRLFTHPDGLPRISTATPVCSRPLIDRLRRQAHEETDDALLDLVTEAEQHLIAAERTGREPAWTGDGVMATFELTTRLGPVRLFTVIATLGAPLDVTAADLAVETFLPADPQSGTRLRALAADRER